MPAGLGTSVTGMPGKAADQLESPSQGTDLLHVPVLQPSFKTRSLWSPGSCSLRWAERSCESPSVHLTLTFSL